MNKLVKCIVVLACALFFIGGTMFSQRQSPKLPKSVNVKEAHGAVTATQSIGKGSVRSMMTKAWDRDLLRSKVITNSVYTNQTTAVVKGSTPERVMAVSTTYVDPTYTVATSGWNVDHFNSIQGGIDAVSPGGTVNVYPGSYNEIASGRLLFDASGPYQFGLFVGQDKAGITVRGVNAGGTPITNYSGVLTAVVTNATNDFGYSGIFVEGDNVTITGLGLDSNTAGDNKTFEVIGDNFTLEYCTFNIPNGGGSVYFDDDRFNTITNTSHVQSYMVAGNSMNDGTSVDIASGAGFSGPVSSRQVINNVFVLPDGSYWPAVSFNGSGSGIPWFVYSVGGAIVTGNNFTNLSSYYDGTYQPSFIRARGTYDNTQFNWTSYWNNNTYYKAVMFGSSIPSAPGTYTYPSGYGTFTDVRLIGALIQPQVDHAVSGNTVQMLAGSYAENLTIATSLTLNGAGQGSTIIYPAVSNPNPCSGSSLCGGSASNIILVEADNVTIHDMTLDGDNPLLTSGFVFGGADIDARNGIITNYNLPVLCNNLDVYNTTVKNIYLRGVYAASGGTFNFHNNIVQNVQADPSSIAMFNFGGSGVFANNTVSYANDAISSNWSTGTNYLNNIITNSGSGVHTDNAGSNGGSPDLIQGNSVSNSSLYGYGIWVFVPYIAPTVQENSVTNVDYALGAFAGAFSPSSTVSTSFLRNTVDGQNKANSLGFYITNTTWGYGTTNVTASVSNCFINNTTYAFDIESAGGNSLTLNASSNSFSGNPNLVYTDSVIALYGGTGTAGTVLADMRGNWWGSITPPSPTGPSVSSVMYSPWLGISTDGNSPLAGFQPVTPMNWYGDVSSTIQNDVNYVASGDVLNLLTGTYVEPTAQVVINKNVSIIGANKITTILTPGQNTGNSGDARGWFLVNSGNTFNLSNVTLDGSGKLVNIAILSYGPGTINNNIFKNLGYNQSGPDYAGRAVRVQDANMSMTNNTLSNIGRIGLYMYGSGVTNGVISGNTYTGKGNGNWLDYGIEIEGGAHATISGNTIKNCTGVATVDGSTSSGMLITTYFALGSQATLTGNTFSNNTVGIAVGYDGTDQSILTAHNNVFSGNTDYGIQTTNPIVDATNNFWGSMFGPIDSNGTVEVPALLTPALSAMKNTIPVGGLGDAVSENVSYYPWAGNNGSSGGIGGVSVGAYGSPISNGVFAGLDPTALDGVDPHDTVAPPPPPSNYVYLYFLLDPGNPLPNYSVDIKKDESSVASVAKGWNLKVLTDLTSHTLTMELPVSSALPSGFQPTLYDLSNNHYVNLRLTPFYTFTSPGSVVPTNFRLLMGDSTKPAVTVTAPNGGDFLVVGTPTNITWTSSDGTGILRHYVYYSLTGGAPYTLIDSTNGNVYSLPWTPPSAASVASIKVVARDSVMNEQYDVSDHSFTILATNGVSFSAQAGWNLISPAMLQTNMSPAGVFGDNYGAIRYFTYQYSTTSGYSVPSALTMGQGYWLGSNSGVVVDAVGTPVSTANLPLTAGFNIIGNPFAVAEPKDSLKFTDGVNTYTMTQAASAGWLSNVLYGYSGGSYFNVPNIGGTLNVWQGYWIPMIVSGKTIQYTPTVGISMPKAGVIADGTTRTHWGVELAATLTNNSESYSDRIASFGVRADAKDGFDPMYDAPRPPRTPVQDFVEISFAVSDGNYAKLFGTPCAREFTTAEKAQWEFVVTTSNGGTVTLNWDNTGIRTLPADVKVNLYDVTNNRLIDMKKATSYTYGQVGTSHQFTVNKVNKAIPTTFELSQNYPNPFNPTTVIPYGLPFDAKVNLEVYDVLGRKIATVVNGEIGAGYHEAQFNAASYASGMYFFRITATAINGKQFSATKKMMLVK